MNHKERIREYARTPERKKKNADYQLRKKREDKNFLIAARLRVRLCIALRQSWKAGSAIDDLGCSIDEFRKHIETQFQPGMTWNNWSLTGWHIDHIRPLSSFDLFDEKQFKTAVHYKNMRPMWAADNLRKASKIES